MNTFMATLFLFLLSSTLVLGEFPNPIPFTSSFPGYVHDPSIAKYGKEYYVFLTHDNVSITTSSSLNGPWKTVGSVLPKGSKIDYAGRYYLSSHFVIPFFLITSLYLHRFFFFFRYDIWAPDVSLYEGVYHLFYAVSTYGVQVSAIGLAVSKTLAPEYAFYFHHSLFHHNNALYSTWTDLGMVFSSGKGSPYNAIDPNMVVNRADNQPFLNFGSFWEGI